MQTPDQVLLAFTIAARVGFDLVFVPAAGALEVAPVEIVGRDGFIELYANLVATAQ